MTSEDKSSQASQATPADKQDGQDKQTASSSDNGEQDSKSTQNAKTAAPSKPIQKSTDDKSEKQPSQSTKSTKSAEKPNTTSATPQNPQAPTDPTASLQAVFAAVTGQTSAKINELSPATQEKISSTIHSITGGQSPTQLANSISPETKEKISQTLTSFDPRDPESRHAIVNMVTSSVSYITGKLPLPEGLGDQLTSELNKATSSGDFFLDQTVSMISDSVNSWVEMAQTERPSAGGVPYKPLGDIDKHARDNTVVSALGGTLGGVTRTLGGTVGALGGGVGDTITNVGPQGQQHVKNVQNGGDGQEQEEGDEAGAEGQPQKKGVGASVSGTGQSITDWSNWTARAMENTSKGYPVQWQDITGNDKRL